MKIVIRLALIAAGVAIVAHLLKEKVVPAPEAPVAHDDAPKPRVARPAVAPAPPVPQANVPQAPTAKPATAAPEEGDDLTGINGIGPVYAGRLAEVGITTFARLAAADPAGLAEALSLPPGRVEDWIDQARRRTA